MTLPEDYTVGEVGHTAAHNATNAAVNAIASFPVTSAGDGTTDVSALFQAAIDGAAGVGTGLVRFGPGVHRVAGLVMRPGVHLVGSGRGVSTLKLVDGANADVLVTQDFATLTGTGSNGDGAGPNLWSVRDLTIDGNRAAQTGASWGIRSYGYAYAVENVTIHSCYSDGLYTEWGLFGEPAGGMEARYRGLVIYDCGGWGWHNRGPHDSMLSDSIIFKNNQTASTAGGLWIEDDQSGTPKYAAGAMVMSGVHVWGDTHSWAMIVDGATIAVNCLMEGGVTGQVLARGPLSYYGGKIFTLDTTAAVQIGLQLGDDGSTAGVPSSFSWTAGECDIRTRLEGFWSATAAGAALNWVAANTSSVEVHAVLRAATGSPQVLWGTADPDSWVAIHGTASGSTRAQRATWSPEWRLGAMVHDVGAAGQAWVLQKNTADVLNLNTTGTAAVLQHVQSMVDRWYSGSYSGETVEIDGGAGHLRWPSTTAPTPTANTAAIGAGGTVTISGNDRRGEIVVTTGASVGSFPASACDVTFATDYGTQPHVTVTPKSASAAALFPYSNAYASTTFLVGLGVAPAPSTAYYFTYTVEG